MGKIELKLEIDAALVAEAQKRGIHLEVATEQGIRMAIANMPQPPQRSEMDARAKRWAEDNADAIEAYRRRIDEYGVFGEDLRRW
jgi:antitoxin CcdA